MLARLPSLGTGMPLRFQDREAAPPMEFRVRLRTRVSLPTSSAATWSSDTVFRMSSPRATPSGPTPVKVAAEVVCELG